MPVRLGMRTRSLSSKRHLAQEWVYVVLISRIPRYFGNVTRPFTVKTWFCWFSFGACVSGGLKEYEGIKRRLVALAASLHWDGIARLLQGWTEWNENSTDARSFCPGESFEWCQLCQLCFCVEGAFLISGIWHSWLSRPINGQTKITWRMQPRSALSVTLFDSFESWRSGFSQDWIMESCFG